MFLILNYLLILIDSQIVALNPLSVNQTFRNLKLYGKIYNLYKQMTIKKMIKFTPWTLDH